MPWLEERTLTLFVRDTEVRRYEPGVRERGVDVERPSGPLMGSADTDTDPDRALSLKAPVIHGHLIRQHFFYVVYRHLSSLIDGLSINGLSRAHYSLACTNCWYANRNWQCTVRSHGMLIHVMIGARLNIGSLTLTDWDRASL
jgi:hypothetical protein